MLERMIKLGFYNNEVELLKIINPIIDLLDGSNDFTTADEEEAYNAFKEKLESEKGRKKKMQQESFKRDKNLRYRNNENNFVIFAIKRKII